MWVRSEPSAELLRLFGDAHRFPGLLGQAAAVPSERGADGSPLGCALGAAPGAAPGADSPQLHSLIVTDPRADGRRGCYQSNGITAEYSRL